jgi:hypothetical protein
MSTKVKVKLEKKPHAIDRRHADRRSVRKPVPLYYRGALIADIAHLGAMDADLGCDLRDPRNAIYLVPLENAGGISGTRHGRDDPYLRPRARNSRSVPSLL